MDKHTFTREVIFHFTCEDCKGWWSIASHYKWKPKKLYCPHCGRIAEITEKT